MKYINVLEHLSEVMECLALEYIRAARSELSDLCSRIKTHEKYQFESYEIAHEALQEALNAYEMRRDIREFASILSRTSRMIWNNSWRKLPDRKNLIKLKRRVGKEDTT